MKRDLQWARSYLREMEKEAVRGRPDQYKVNQSAHSTLNAILNYLESQKSPETPGLIPHRHEDWRGFKSGLPILETPGSESTLPASDGANLEMTTPSSASQSPQPESGTTEDFSSAIRLGRQLAEAATPLTRARLSKTQEPTPSTSETDQDIGRSASIGEVSHEQAQRALGNLIATCFRQRHGATFSIPVRDTDDDIILSRYIDQQSSLSSSSASAGGESEVKYRVESQAETALTLLQRYVAREGHDCGAYGLAAKEELWELCYGCEANWKAYRSALSPSPSSSQEEETR